MPDTPEPTALSQFVSPSLARRIAAPVELSAPGSHLGLTWRRLTADDVEQAHALSIACEDDDKPTVSPCLPGLTRQTARALADPNVVDSLAGFDAHGQMQALAFVETLTQPLSELQADLFALISPAWRGRGLGRALLDWQDGRARQMLLDDGRDLPISIRCMVEAHQVERRRLLAAGGFSPALTYASMTRTITEADVERAQSARDRLKERGLEIRPVTEDIEGELRRLHNRLAISIPRSQPISPERWQVLMDTICRDCSVILTDDDAIVGFALATTDEEGPVIIGHFGVDRALRNSGIGTDLIISRLDSRLFDAKKDLLVPVALGGRAHQPFLSRAGFVEASSRILYTIDI